MQGLDRSIKQSESKLENKLKTLEKSLGGVFDSMAKVQLEATTATARAETELKRTLLQSREDLQTTLHSRLALVDQQLGGTKAAVAEAHSRIDALPSLETLQEQIESTARSFDQVLRNEFEHRTSALGAELRDQLTALDL